MYNSILSRRLLASRYRIQGLLSTTTAIHRNGSASWQSVQRVSISSTSPLSSKENGNDHDDDDEDAPWNAVEGRHNNTDSEWDGCRRDFMAPLEIGVRGPDILNNAFFNKGTAFKTEERDRLRFRGLVPARFTNIKMQKARFLKTLRATTSDIQKNIQLEDLHDLNETLYHRILVDHIEGTYGRLLDDIIMVL
jgi:hypothetical protein